VTGAEADRALEVLVVEDNPGDVRLTVRAFGATGVPANLSVVDDGAEALAFLRQQEDYVDAPRPDLILLDLNMPIKDGHEVLAEVKADASLKRIPVIVLTASHAREDVVMAYDLHANCYINKPVDFDEFVGVIQSIERFWTTVACLPDVADGANSACSSMPPLQAVPLVRCAAGS
jgi:CheY-like chemotaxis protein